MKMSVYVDIDDTIFDHGTNNWKPEAEEIMQKMHSQGVFIVLTTARGDKYPYPHVYSKRATLEALANKHIKYDEIIFNSPSPRVMFNDRMVLSVQVDPKVGLTNAVLDEVTGYLLDDAED